MRKLSRIQVKALDALKLEVQADLEELNEKIAEYTKAAGELFEEKVQPALEALNNKLESLRSFRDDITSAQEDYIGDRSDKWLEDDAGSRYQAWHEAWRDAELDDVEINRPEDIEEAAEVSLDDLTEEPD